MNADMYMVEMLLCIVVFFGLLYCCDSLCCKDNTESAVENDPLPLVDFTELPSPPAIDYLDLPPTYAISTANSASNSVNDLRDDTEILISNSNGRCTSLPTYEDALINIALGEPVPPTPNNIDTDNDYRI